MLILDLAKIHDQFEWKRPRKKLLDKREKNRHSVPSSNEIWHLDVSYFILPDKTKCFVRALIDTTPSMSSPGSFWNLVMAQKLERF